MKVFASRSIMSRVVLSIGIAWLATSWSHAQQPPTEPLGSTATLDELSVHESAQNDAPSARRLAVRAASEPEPAFRFRFWPTPLELVSDSAQMRLLRVEAAYREVSLERRGEILNAVQTSEEHGTTVEELLALERHVSSSLWIEIDRMALCNDTRFDLGLVRLTGVAAFMEPLTEVQTAREIGHLIHLRAKRQILQSDWPGFAHSMRNGFRLAHVIGNGETIVQQFVGIAISDQMFEMIEFAAQQPKSPDFYWALATLPRPLIDPRRALALEQESAYLVFPLLQHPETLQLSDAEWQRQWTEGMAAIAQLRGEDAQTNPVSTFAISAAQSNGARERLLQQGFNARDIDEMNIYQRLAIDAAREVRHWRDEFWKYHYLPYRVARPLTDESSQRFGEWANQQRTNSAAVTILETLLPPVNSVVQSHVRHEMTLNRLMTMEALRLHAATHKGQLPNQLDDLQPVPALLDPYTDAPFEYRKSIDNGQQVVSLRSTVRNISVPSQRLLPLELTFPPTTP